MTSPEPSPTDTRTASLSVSKSTADTRAYGIDAAVAALPIGPEEFATEDYFATDAPQAFAGRPGSWRLAGFFPSADLQHVPQLSADGLVFARDPNQSGGGRALRLDPATLK